MRKFEFIKPQITVEKNESEHYGKFVITPLERGYGITLGNALRRVLLSSMPGVAIVAMDIEGTAAMTTMASSAITSMKVEMFPLLVEEPMV